MAYIYLTPSAISYLTQPILALAITGYFLYRFKITLRQDRQPHLSLLIGFFGSISLFSLLLFAEASLPRGYDFYSIYAQTTVLRDRISAVIAIFLLAFRDYLHQFFAPLAYLILGASLLVIVGFPGLLYTNLVRPLNALIEGERQLNAGHYDVKLTKQKKLPKPPTAPRVLFWRR